MLVAVTGYGQEEDRRRSEESGFDHHLTKPVDPDDLQTLIVGHRWERIAIKKVYARNRSEKNQGLRTP